MLKNLLTIRNINILFRQTEPLLKNAPSFALRTLSTKEEKGFVQAATPDENAGVLEDTSKNYANPFAGEKNQQTSQLPPANDEDKARRLKVLQLEVEIARQGGRRVPKLDFFQDSHWAYVLSLPTKSARIKYYSYLWQIETKTFGKERKKLERAEANVLRKEEERVQNEENNHIIYGLNKTTMFLRIYDSTINHWQNNRLIRAMQFSPKIVLDCSYDEYMTNREAQNAAKQLMLTFADNRAHDDPFDLHFCNVNLNSVCSQGLHRYIPTMLNPEFPMNVHEQCYTKLFPKENLVYLTPHCRTDLEAYNHDDVYIIGAMVDTVNNEPLSLAKAKKLGLRMARLPLDNYLQWGAGSGKSLTLNQMIKIMLDLKCTRDWEKALTHVPRRKIVDWDQRPQRQRYAFPKQGGGVNVRVDKLLNFEREHLRSSSNEVRSRKENLQFNLETWGAKKKNH